jgi:uncharacterized protein
LHRSVDSTIPSKELAEKYAQLQALLADIQSVAVAYSGGVDSTLLAKVTYDVLGDKMLAVMAISESMSSSELENAIALLDELDIPHVTVQSNEVHDPRYAANPANRCYFCRGHILRAIHEVAQKRGLAAMVDGFNLDDASDHRPGRQAGIERSVRSPLYETGFTKQNVRSLARHLGLRNWSKPSTPCLSSRVPYDTPITPAILHQIDRAESVLRKLGLTQLRVRHHGNMARIEVPPDNMALVFEHRAQIVADFKEVGYIYVALDLQGFRSGSANEELIDGREPST